MSTDTPPKALRVLAQWPNRLECLRTYSPGYVAEMTGVSMSTVYSYRSGQRPVPLDVLGQLVSTVEPRVDIVEAFGFVLMVEPA